MRVSLTRSRHVNVERTRDFRNGVKEPTAVPAGADTLETSVLRSLDRYFSDLDGARPHALHELVMQAVERPLLKFAVDRCAGNQSAAADLLGMNRNTLRRKLVEYGLL